LHSQRLEFALKLAFYMECGFLMSLCQITAMGLLWTYFSSCSILMFLFSFFLSFLHLSLSPRQIIIYLDWTVPNHLHWTISSYLTQFLS
jgi:hypothetical protein